MDGGMDGFVQREVGGGLEDEGCCKRYSGYRWWNTFSLG